MSLSGTITDSHTLQRRFVSYFSCSFQSVTVLNYAASACICFSVSFRPMTSGLKLKEEANYEEKCSGSQL